MRALSPVLAALVLHLVLVLPNHPGAATPRALLLFPLELPAILLALAALPGRQRALRAAIVAALALLSLLKLADFGFTIAFNRGFDAVTDRGLLVSAWHLGQGALGLPLALAAITALTALLALAAALIWWATGQWTGLARGRGLRAGCGLGAVLAAAVAVAEVGQAMRAWELPADPPGAAFTARTGVERALRIRRTLVELDAFAAATATDTVAGMPGLLSRLAGREVIVVFIESYGRASLDNPLYAPAHTAILAAAEPRLAEAGLAVRTAWLTSPIEGGQSWLAHATLASGLSVGDQTRHAALLASPRRTLWQIAGDAGWRTAAISPAITLPWPEAARLGFSTYLGRDAMGYAGRPFNWITMPDQFTLARFRDRLPPDPDGDARALFAQVTLISSHAPWVPVPDPLPWEAIGDGTEFDAMATRGDPPEVVWRDPDRIRAQYRDALGYSLTVALDWAARQGEVGGVAGVGTEGWGQRATGAGQGGDPDAPVGPPLILILGDHPAAAFVSQIGNRDVPAHLIGPPEVLALLDAPTAPPTTNPTAEPTAPLPGTWGWTPGLIPGPATPRWPMQAFRDRFLHTFSGAAP